MTKNLLYLCLSSLLLVGACGDDDEPSIDWAQEEFYTPQTDQTNSDELAVEIAGGPFVNRRESIEELAERLGLTPYPARDSLLSADEVGQTPPPFSFRVYSVEVDADGQVIGALPGLSSSSLSDSIRGWQYQSGRYIFRFQESDTHRFVSIVQKLAERSITDSEGQELTIAGESSARLYVNEEAIIENALGLKRERLTFAGEVGNLAELYPGLRLPSETVALSDYRYDTVLADSLDDGSINEQRVRVLLSVFE